MLPLKVPSSQDQLLPWIFFPSDSALQPESLHHTRGVAASGFRPLRNIPTAASRRSLGRVSVPVWLIVLSDQLPIVALVGHYPTNKLMGRELIKRRKLQREATFYHSPSKVWSYPVLAEVSLRYPRP